MTRCAPQWVRQRGLCAAVATLAVLGLIRPSSAHFLWISGDCQEDGSVVVHAFFAEHDVPELPTFLKYLENATFSTQGQPLSHERGEDTFILRLPADRPGVIDGELDFGITSRSETSFRLLYTARAQFGPLADEECCEESEGLRASLVEDEEGSHIVRILFNGQPAAGSIVKITHEDGEIREVTADDDGQVVCPDVAAGRAALLAKWFDGIPGERDGEAYPETRHYATLTVIPTQEPSDPDTVADLRGQDRTFPLIPEPINSFGGAVLGDHLYIYSGHTGTTHRYHTGTTNPHFYRLDLRDRAFWEELPCQAGLQGVALVAHGGKLYRTGGMFARNGEGEDHDLISVDEVACFDPETNAWTALPPMPEPRSTHDAAVLGDHLYVVGGWSMTGGDANGAYFLDDAFRLDLTRPEDGWEEIPGLPIDRRALAVAAHEGKIYAVGGLLENSSTVRTVDVFDPGQGTWSSGPELPGPPIQGFAPSAFSVGGRLLASGGSGTVYRLSESGDSWEAIAEQAVPRITHRLLPGIDGDALIVGGNFVGIPVRFVESIPTDPAASGPKAVAWEVELPGDALQSHAAGLVGSHLILAGGNRSPNPHAFEAENLSDQVLSVRLDGSEAEVRPSMPEALQSGLLVTAANGRRSDTYLLGGIAEDAGVVRSLGSVYRHNAQDSTWERLDAAIPDDRGMFGAAVHGGAVWVFGGSIYDPRPEADTRGFPTEILRWQLDTEGGTFEATGHQLPRARRSFAGTEHDGKYVLVGGLGEDQRMVDVVDVFDFASGRWETIPTPDRPRVFADLVAIDGKLYLGGGFAPGPDGHFEAVRSVEVYDPERGAWDIALDAVPIDTRSVRLMNARGRMLLFGIDASDPRRARLALMSPQASVPTAAEARQASAGPGAGTVAGGATR